MFWYSEGLLIKGRGTVEKSTQSREPTYLSLTLKDLPPISLYWFLCGVPGGVRVCFKRVRLFVWLSAVAAVLAELTVARASLVSASACLFGDLELLWGGGGPGAPHCVVPPTEPVAKHTLHGPPSFWVRGGRRAFWSIIRVAQHTWGWSQWDMVLVALSWPFT